MVVLGRGAVSYERGTPVDKNKKTERQAGPDGVQRFRGGLVVKAHRLCVSLNSRLESNRDLVGPQGAGGGPARGGRKALSPLHLEAGRQKKKTEKTRYFRKKTAGGTCWGPRARGPALHGVSGRRWSA